MKSLQTDPMIVVRIVAKVGVAFIPTGKSAPVAAVWPIRNLRLPPSRRRRLCLRGRLIADNFFKKNAGRPVTGLKFHKKTGQHP